MSLNKFIAIGRLTRDPELKFTAGTGNAVTTFTIAIDDGYGDKKTTAFIPVVVWGKGAEAVANHTHKGSLVAVQGKVNTRSYDNKEGKKVYITEIVADNFNGVQFLDGKSNNNQASSNSTEGSTEYGADITPVDDGEIPF